MWLNTLSCYQQFVKKCWFHTLWWDFAKTAVLVPCHSAMQRGKYKRTLFSHIGMGVAWTHYVKGTSSFVYWGVKLRGSKLELADMPQPQYFSHGSCPNVLSKSAVCPDHPLCLWPVVSLVWAFLQVRVGGDTSDVQLVKLLPNTAYTLSLFALAGESMSEPLTQQGVTRM